MSKVTSGGSYIGLNRLLRKELQFQYRDFDGAIFISCQHAAASSLQTGPIVRVAATHPGIQAVSQVQPCPADLGLGGPVDRLNGT